MKKEILITGGAGFIGSHLVEELCKYKNYNITVIDDLSTGKLDNLPTPSILKKPIELYIDKIQNVKLDKKFDLIWHLAASISTRETGMEGYINNVMATEVTTKMLKPNGHIYFSSTYAIYGKQKYVSENSTIKPISPYGYAKWMNELTIKDNCKNWTIFRFSNVFGERQNGSEDMGLIGIIEYNLKNNTAIKVFNKGKNSRDYTYVKDIVKALTTINKKDIFQLGRSETYNTLKLVKLSGVKWSYGDCNDEVNSIKANNTKILQEGWKPTLSVTEYIERLKNEK